MPLAIRRTLIAPNLGDATIRNMLRKGPGWWPRRLLRAPAGDAMPDRATASAPAFEMSAAGEGRMPFGSILTGVAHEVAPRRQAAGNHAPAPRPEPVIGALAGLDSSEIWDPEPFASEDPFAKEASPAPDGPAAAPRPRQRLTKKRVALAVVVVLFCGMAGAYTQKDTLTPKFANFSRSVIGDERTARVESYFFTLQDHIDRVKYKYFGGTTNPFSATVSVEIVPEAPGRQVVYYIGRGSKPGAAASSAILSADTLGPAPMELPKITQLAADPQPGEDVWTTAGLPHSSPNDVLMAKTFVRPDRSRPYALVGVELFDSRRIRLHMTAGVSDPGGFRGVKGPGAIPTDQYANLLAAWNGGFKGPHGNFGMYADGTEYVPLRNGLASIAVYKDGTIRMGDWGADISWDPNMVAVRQNAVLLVQDGQVSNRTAEGNDTWGYVNVNSAEFITWRSAVGLTKDGNLIYASGNSLSAATLAKALQAAGAWTAMQLDINTPYVLLGNYFQQPDGTVKGEKFMDTMSDSPSRFLHTQERDFMWLTLDESRYR